MHPNCARFLLIALRIPTALLIFTSLSAGVPTAFLGLLNVHSYSYNSTETWHMFSVFNKCKVSSFVNVKFIYLNLKGLNFYIIICITGYC